MNIFSTFRTNLKSKRSGFTLIELLIVMVIITVLATIGLVAYTKATQNAKNAKAIGDMKSIQSALEQAYTKNGGRYTTVAGGSICDTSSLEMTPVAPTNVSYSNMYCSDNAYCVCATLVSGSTTGNAGGTTTSTTCPAFASSGGFFCVKNRQ